MLDENKNKTDLDENNITSTDSLLDDDLLSEGEGIVDLKEIRKKANNEKRINKILQFVVFVLVIAFLVVFGFYYFLKLSLSNNKIIGYDKKYMEIVNEYVLQKISPSSSKKFYTPNKDTNLVVKKMNSYIDDKSIFFYKKQESFKKFTSSFKKDVLSKLSSINNVKDKLVKYRYLPKELTLILKDIKLTPILMTLSSIKLYITDYVYINMGTFDKYVLSKVVTTKQYRRLNNIVNGRLSEIIKKDIVSLRELGAKTYLKDEVFNYMYDASSEKRIRDNFQQNYVIADFYKHHKVLLDERYNYFKKYEPNLDKESFLTDYINVLISVYDGTNNLFEELNKDELPVNINLLNYDPEKQILTFNITLTVDSSSNVNVIKLSTDIITLLRESRLIIGSNINFDKLTVNEKMVNNTIYNTVDLIFQTSVQKEVNVEVTDSKLDKFRY